MSKTPPTNPFKNIDDKYHVVENTKKGMLKTGAALKEFDEKHHVIDNTKKSIAAASKFVSEALKNKNETKSSDTNNTIKKV